MLHLIGNSLKLKIKTPVAVFWPLVFPLLMATLFYFALNDIDNGNFESTPVAVVEVKGEEHDMKAIAFNEFMESVENENDKEPLLKAKYVSEEEALKMLENKEVKGVFYVGNEVRLKFSGQGMGENIISAVYEKFNENFYTISTIAEKKGSLESISSDMRSNFVEDYSFGGKSLKMSSEFFFALIGMTCLYGGFIGLECTKVLKANLSMSALRCSVAPTNKMKLILSEMISTVMIHFVNVIILLIYLRYILKISLTGNIPKMLIVVFSGCLIGVSIGIFIGSLKSRSMEMKIGLFLAVSMSMSFGGGLMNGRMKYIIENNIPMLNRINPVALISDAMYSINIYDDPERFAKNVAILTGISIILIIAAFISVRRERYDSI